ncbi:MAG: hypothetical protein ACOX0Z_02605 [Candidatus Nanosyncoccaceae bacterium]|jgi:hypothetical protein
MSYANFLKKEWRFTLDAVISDLKNKRDPDFFDPYGTQVHCGRQGSGKTISAVHVVNSIKKRYPKAVLVSNLSLFGYRAISTAEWLCYNAQDQTMNGSVRRFDPVKDYVHFSTNEDLHVALTKINNGTRGVIYLIDEIHIYFNSLDSKNIPVHIFTEISQQRKQRKLIVGTSQLFMRMAKPLREQCDNIVMCNTVFGCFTVMRCYDGMTLEQDYNGNLIGVSKGTGFFVHSLEDRNSFDTFQKVVSSEVQFDQLVKPEAKEKRRLGFIRR